MSNYWKKRSSNEKRIGFYPEDKKTQARAPVKRDSRAGRWTPAFRKGILALCTIIFLVSAGQLIRYYQNINRAKVATSELRQIYAQNESGAETEEPSQNPTETPVPAETELKQEEITAETTLEEDEPTTELNLLPTAVRNLTFAENWPSQYENNPQLRISDTFQQLRQQNKDVVGWLTIDGVLDEPVLQRDNAFYLTHDATGAENATGALFLDENCNLRTLTHNLLIHGHNMKEGAMFGSLKKYKVKDAEFYKAHPYITFNTLYEEAKYVIFAVAEVNIRSSEHYYVPFWLYLNFNDEDSFTTYLSKLKEFSHFQTQVDVRPGDRLLTLATCSGTDTATRLLVAARKLRDQEDTIALNQGILSTQVK